LGFFELRRGSSSLCMSSHSCSLSTRRL
jgi:hypothetical protein